jgi:DNA-binding transcriptional MerR regulator
MAAAKDAEIGAPSEPATQGPDLQPDDGGVHERPGPGNGVEEENSAKDSRLEEGAGENGRPRAAGKSVTAFRTISEVSADLEVPQHVLRFWEGKFTQLRPLKRGGGRRYYRPEDIALLRRIHGLLYREGYTIKGVQQVLRKTRGSEGAARTADRAAAAEPTIPGLPRTSAPTPSAPTSSANVSNNFLGDLLTELRQLRRLLE